MKTPEQIEAFNRACLGEPKNDIEALARLKHSKTSRGFDIVRVSGERAADLVIQESSVYRYDGPPGSSALWFSIESLAEGGDSAHLDFHIVKELHALLGRWLEKGELA